MKNTDSVPREKKKKKRNLWPLKALVITFVLAAAVNAASTLVLEDSHWWLATLLTVIILLVGVVFDMIGTASTACDEGPFLSMASRKVRGAKLAVKLSKKSDVVSSVCCDIVGDVCGIVSGVCAATIAAYTLNLNGSFWWTVLIYAVISTLTITLKAVGKGIAIKQANKIIFGVAKALSIFRKEG
ncbi:MAG: Mg2+ and Co2+ transporter CorB [Clostridiales bacterium]|nr:Mg2+ and Co2+ transporter CorB [Clostridiales bacterium]